MARKARQQARIGLALRERARAQSEGVRLKRGDQCTSFAVHLAPPVVTAITTDEISVRAGEDITVYRDMQGDIRELPNRLYVWAINGVLRLGE